MRDVSGPARSSGRAVRRAERTNARRVLILALIGLSFPLLSGCGLLYRSRQAGESFVLYADRGQEFLDDLKPRVEEIYDALVGLFELERRDLGKTMIFLEGDNHGVIDHSYSPSLLGYYVPLFNMIRVDTEPAWAQDPEALRQVLVHEISHHFLVRKYPGVSETCWLNEGLAGNLEVGVIEAGRSEFPLFHPALARIAKTSLRDPEVPTLERLLALEWSDFHESETKVRHYALSWAIVYYILEEVLPGDLPLGERIDRLVRMGPEDILPLEKSWRAFFERLDVTEAFIELARSDAPERRLSARWAVRQMGELTTLEDPRTLPTLVALFEKDDPARREAALFSFLQVLERNPHVIYFTRRSVELGLERLGRLIHDDGEGTDLRSGIVSRLGSALPERSAWIERLVPLLETRDAELRAAAAAALGRMAAKPTIVNPSFWHHAPVSAREREVGEWKEWLASQGG